MPSAAGSVYSSPVRRFLSALLALATTSLVLTACDDDAPRGEVREWRASDHQQPASPEPERMAPEPGQEPPPEMVARAAASLFEIRCASCHGATGQGDGPEAPTPAMPDLTSAAYHEGKTDADIARAIRMGQGLMPAFGGQLNDRGITALVGHVRSLRAGG